MIISMTLATLDSNLYSSVVSVAMRSAEHLEDTADLPNALEKRMPEKEKAATSYTASNTKATRTCGRAAFNIWWTLLEIANCEFVQWQ